MTERVYINENDHIIVIIQHFFTRAIELLVDGGVSNNLPIDVARDMGADVVIVVDISTPLLKKEQLISTLSVTDQLTGILTRKNTEEQLTTLTENDVLIIPELGDIAQVRLSVLVELGNVWQDKDDIVLNNSNFGGSIYVGVDTLIGPLYLAYGTAKHDHQSFYFLLGKLF